MALCKRSAADAVHWIIWLSAWPLGTRCFSVNEVFTAGSAHSENRRFSSRRTEFDSNDQAFVRTVTSDKPHGSASCGAALLTTLSIMAVRHARRKPGFAVKLCIPLSCSSQDAERSTDVVLSEPRQVKSWSALLMHVIAVAGPNMGTFFLQLINEQTNVIFLGRGGSDAALAAVGLGNMMQNCLGLSIAWGLLGALDTFVSQANGAGQADLACTYLQRGRIIASLQLLWIIPVLFSSEALLTCIGQDKLVSSLAAAYNRASAPALFCYFQFQATAKFLQNKCINLPPMIVNLCCSILHVGWCAFFVGRLSLGNAGAGYANAVTWTTQWLLISLYVVFAAPRLGISRRAVLGLGKKAWQDWFEYLKVGLPCVLQTSSEWWFWELCALVVGYLGTVSLAAHVAAMQFVALAFMPAIGISAAAAGLVGNALGANDPDSARRLLMLCVGVNLGIWSVVAGTIFAGHSVIASLYVPKGTVSNLMQSLLIIFGCVGFVDTTQNVMAGALRGMGKMTVSSVVYMLSYYGLMLPVGCLLAFRMGHGVRGVWFAMGIGTTIAVTIFSWVLARTKFSVLAEKISGELRAGA